ncbi:MAG: T9SS C-terminal target domain-containing protein [Ignavibacteriales bacterium]|nr:T9SS C-terminal target domain-containing protein [Ignavibacteriales bacterium]
MKSFYILLASLLIATNILFTQSQQYEVHKRGMLHQSIFNTGELGRALDNGTGKSLAGQPSFEWPGNSGMIIDGVSYNGFYNSFGGGLYIAADTGVGARTRKYIQCGAATDNGGHSMAVENVYSFPVSINRIENYPVFSNGQLNLSYNPDEAEEIIISKWDTPLGITVTRTSRMWSFPDYDDFIIYDYELENTGNHTTSAPPYRVDTLRAVIVAFGYSLAPSMFAGERVNDGIWLEGSYRSDKPDVSKMSLYGRFDWRRYMIYNHQMDGVPDPKYFDLWSTTGQNGGGLTAPAAVGVLPLYYDYEHLAGKGDLNVAYAGGTLSDSAIVWDENNKLKQPYNIRFDNANLNIAKLQTNLNCEESRYNAPFRLSDTTAFGKYWIGRGKPNWTSTLRNPTGKIYGFGPYTIYPGDKIHFVVAEVAGFGAGVASDSQYVDLGGGWGNNGSPTEPSPGVHEVPSWYSTVKYDYLNNKDPNAVMGSNYLRNHPIPDYVNSNVVSIRDVADRAIQMFKGGPVLKYDTLQFEPSGGILGASSVGDYKVPIPFPAPAIIVQNTFAASNKIIWGSQTESFTSSRLIAPFSHYEVIVANSPIGPWSVLDSVATHDLRYYKDTSGLGDVYPLVLTDSAYVYLDYQSNIGAGYYYAVVAVDSFGGRSGKTNLVYHNTQAPAVSKLGKVYAAPNPFIVSSRSSGTSISGDITNKIGFFGLPEKCTIRIFSYSGQLVETIEHNSNEYSSEWFQVSRNNQWIASGVYYFTVDDDKGNRSWNKFVIIH